MSIPIFQIPIILFSLLVLFVQESYAQFQYDCTDNSITQFLHQLNINASPAEYLKDLFDQQFCKERSSLSTEDRASLACHISHLVITESTYIGEIPEYLDPGSSSYINRTQVNWSDNCWQNASCILAPSTTDQISRFFKIVTFTGAKFAVRSGGHNPNVGFGSVGPSGVLIDMVNINQTILSSDKQTVSIGAGQKLGPAYATLDKLGYYFSGGKDPNPGVGGFYLGAGIIYFASEYGMGANGVKNIEIVLANSSVIEANATSNADLLWAIRGGGPNYGIITRYDVEALPKPTVWFEYRVYNPSQVQQLLVAMIEYQKAAEIDSDASIVFQSFPMQTLMGYIHKGGISWPSTFTPFQNIPYNTTFVNSTVGSPYQLVEATAGAQGEAELKYASISIALQPDLNTYKETYTTYLEVAKSVAQNFSGVLAYGIQPFTSSAVRRSQRNGGTPLNLTEVSQTWFICEVEWADEAASDAALAAVEQVGAAVQEAADSRNISLPFHFMNDANYKQNVFKGYGLESLARLRAIAAKYDSTGVFQNLQNDGYLLSKAG